MIWQGSYPAHLAYIRFKELFAPVFETVPEKDRVWQTYSELMGNAIRASTVTDDMIHACFMYADNHLVLTIDNEGVSFVPTELHFQLPPDDAIHGRGLYLALVNCDGLAYTKFPNMTRVMAHWRF